jgi:hypothetical protein
MSEIVVLHSSYYFLHYFFYLRIKHRYFRHAAAIIFIVKNNFSGFKNISRHRGRSDIYGDGCTGSYITAGSVGIGPKAQKDRTCLTRVVFIYGISMVE